MGVLRTFYFQAFALILIFTGGNIMADFNAASIRVNGQIEGGTSNNAADSGGLTNLGLTQTDIDNYRHGNSSFPAINPAQLTTAQAQTIAKALYWTPLNLDAVNNQVVAQAIYACGLNQGINTCGQLVQQSLNYFGCLVVVDGIIGQQTVNALNVITVKKPGAFLTRFNIYRKREYEAIINHNPTQAVFREGWDRNIIMSSTPTPGDEQ